MSPEVIAVTESLKSSDKSPKESSKDGSFLNSTFESTIEDQPDNFALKSLESPARINIAHLDDEIGADS